jgi:pimeloyl-ACP methyl ester carboxylesterase
MSPAGQLGLRAGEHPARIRAIPNETREPNVRLNRERTHETASSLRSSGGGDCARQLPREELVAACRAQSPGWPEVGHRAWADAHREVNPAIFDARHPMHGPWQRELAKTDCPLLLIAGEPRLGSMVNAEAASELMRHTNRARLIRIPGAGHSVHRDRYEQFMRLAREFLTTA